jgi:hypothetical protein
VARAKELQKELETAILSRPLRGDESASGS